MFNFFKRKNKKAGKATLPTTATVEIKKQTISQFNAGTKQLKLKFPLK